MYLKRALLLSLIVEMISDKVNSSVELILLPEGSFPDLKSVKKPTSSKHQTSCHYFDESFQL